MKADDKYGCDTPEKGFRTDDKNVESIPRKGIVKAHIRWIKKLNHSKFLGIEKTGIVEISKGKWREKGLSFEAKDFGLGTNVSPTDDLLCVGH